MDYKEKKARLMAFVTETLGYCVDLICELAIAQHPSRLLFRIERNEKEFRFHPLPASGK